MNKAPENIPLRRHALSHLETYDVTAQELNTIEMESLDVGQDLQFASIALAIAVSFLIALLLTDISSPTRFACFVAVVITFGVLALFFFIQYFRKRRGTRTAIQDIRDRQVGPVGEEGRELRPAEIDQLPVTTAVHLSDSFASADAAEAALHPAPAVATVTAPATTPPPSASEIPVPQSGEQK